MNPLLFGVLGYVALQLGFGFFVARRIVTEEDYLVGGRRLGPTISLFTIFATWFGAETCIGAAGQAFSGGLSATPAEPFGYAICLLIMGMVFAVPLWRRRIVTLADLFRSRYGVSAERLSVLLMVPTSLLWAGAQIRAFGQILAAFSDLEVEITVTIAAVVVIVYTSMGGLLADAYSDVVQGCVLVAGLLAVGFLFLRSGDAAALGSLGAERLSFTPAGWSALDVAEAWAVPIVGSLVAQELVARVMASRSPQVARSATVGAAAVYFFVGLIPVTLGLAAAAHLQLDEPEQVLVTLAGRYLPDVLHVLFAGALVSAILSTVDSALLVAGSLVAHNLVLPLRREASQHDRVRINRIAVVAAGGIGYTLALSSEGVHSLVQEASGFGSTGIVVAVAFGLFTRLGGSTAALAAMITGVVVYCGGYLGILEHPFLWSLAAALVAFLAASLPGHARERGLQSP